jgi:hypothetical protein
MLCIYRNFCPKKEKVTGVPGKLDYDKLCYFYSSPDIICVLKENRCAGLVAHIWGGKCIQVVGWKT